MTDTDAFEANRELLFAVAYRMLGTVDDAEDAVQDTWLRWSAAPRSDVGQPRAYLATTITHVALNKLRSARARREAYIGPWLPEPLLTSTGPDAADRAELAESVSLAMLVVLESLTPEERAVFVLHEVFGFPHTEIAAAIGRSDAAVRQLMHRAAGVLVTAGGRPLAAVTTAVADGRITAIQLVANPDKLRALQAGRTLPL